MATPVPSPGPATEPPAPPAPVMPSGPTCAACGTEAVVHWRRRPTADELAEHVAAEQSRRTERRLLADPQQPPPLFGPLPAADDTTRTIYACGPHAITLDAATRIHASTCTAPNEAHLPGCNCTPEPLPEPEPDTGEAPSRLPAHWLPGGQ